MRYCGACLDLQCATVAFPLLQAFPVGLNPGREAGCKPKVLCQHQRIPNRDLRGRETSGAQMLLLGQLRLQRSGYFSRLRTQRKRAREDALRHEARKGSRQKRRQARITFVVSMKSSAQTPRNHWLAGS